MKLSTLIILATLLLSTYNATAQADVLDHDDHEANEFMSTETSSKPRLVTKVFGGPGEQYEPFLGLPMRYPTYADPRANANIGVAFLQNGMPVVAFGPQTAQALGPDIMGFFMQHEYAHHDLRHPIRQDIPSAVKEAQADCAAAKSLVQNGKGYVIPEIVNWMNNRGCNYNPATPIENVQDSHPCGVQRAQIIQECSQV